MRFGRTTFQPPSTLLLDGTVLTGRAAAIATGSRPAIPAVPGLAETGFLTNETVFDLTTLPVSLAIIGGCLIGVELGQAFARLGSRITIIQRSARLLSREDLDVSSAIASVLQADGVYILTHSGSQSEYTGKGLCAYSTTGLARATGYSWGNSAENGLFVQHGGFAARSGGSCL